MVDLAPDFEARRWLRVLNEALVLRWARVRTFQDYYEGNHRLLFASQKFKESFGGLFAEFADNFCPLVVDAEIERLTVQGFRLEKDAQADEDAWAIWQFNSLDAGSEIAHTEALICEESAVLVEPPAPGDKYPTVHIEHPSQVIVAMSPGNRAVRIAALKRWVDDAGDLRANVYLPDMVWKYKAKGDGAMFQGWILSGNTQPASVELQWQPYTIDGEEQHAPNPLGVVPIVPLRNKPRLLTVATSELATVIPVQDAINKLTLDMMVSAEYAAMPQRFVTGLPLKVDPQTNQVLPPFNVVLNKILQAEDPEAKFGTFPTAELDNYTKAVEMLVQHVATQTRTPRHYFYASGQSPSGDAIKSAETGLVAKARQQARHFGDRWEEVIRLCFLAMGDSKKAEAWGAETIWADPEFHSQSELVDALVKQKALDIPNEILWEKAGYSPLEIDRIKDLIEAEKAAAPTEVDLPVLGTAKIMSDGTTAAPPAAGGAPPVVPAHTHAPASKSKRIERDKSGNISRIVEE